MLTREGRGLMTVATIAVYVGLDVGKGGHHAVALDPAGVRLRDRALPQDEGVPRAILTNLQAPGPVLLVVAQPASIGALPLAVAEAIGVRVGYLPGLTMRRVADQVPGEAKTDARDAFIIAEAARTLPQTIRDLTATDDLIAQRTMLRGFDDDPRQQSTAVSNRLRGLVTQIHPALERVLGPAWDRRGVLALLQRWPTPQDLGTAGTRRIAACLARRGSRRADTLAAAIGEAVRAQTGVVAGTAAAGAIIPRRAFQLARLHQDRAAIAAQVAALVEPHPLCPVLTSLPGVGVRTAARILITTPGKEFASAADLASYAGLAPVTWQSGASVRGERAPRGGTKVLQDALFQAAFTSPRHPPSRVYYDRKRADGKRPTQAVLALARRRTDVLHAMIRDGTCYQPPEALTNT